jgi:hypothetical protein
MDPTLQNQFMQSTAPSYMSDFTGGAGANAGGSSGGSSPFGNFNMGGAMLGGGIAGLLGGLFGNQTSPASAANQYMNQMPGAISPYMSPYMQAGGQALGNLQGQFGNLMQNPGGMMNQIGSQYHQSPGFNFALQQALHGAGMGAAAGGMAGSPMAQQQNMGVATGMANQDYYNWLGNAQNMYGMGIHGAEGLAGMGMQAGTNMSNVIANQLSQQAADAYQQQAAQNQAQSGMFGDIEYASNTTF